MMGIEGIRRRRPRRTKCFGLTPLRELVHYANILYKYFYSSPDQTSILEIVGYMQIEFLHLWIEDKFVVAVRLGYGSNHS